MISVEATTRQGLCAIADVLHVSLRRSKNKISGEGVTKVVYEDLFDLKLDFKLQVRSAAITPVGDVVVLVNMMGGLGLFVGYDANDGDLVLAVIDRMVVPKPSVVYPPGSHPKISMRGLFEEKQVTSVQSALRRVYKTFAVPRLYVKAAGATKWSDMDSGWWDDAEAVGA